MLASLPIRAVRYVCRKDPHVERLGGVLIGPAFFSLAEHPICLGKALQAGTGPLWWVAEDAGAAGDGAEPSALETEQVRIY
jgi:hypothetical protein